MLVEKLSTNDIRLIDDYRKNYAFNSDSCDTSSSFEPISYILREWDKRKFEYLYKLLGEQFTISKYLNYSKSYEELQEEIANFTSRRYGRAERSGEIFTQAYMDMLYPPYYVNPKHKFTDEVRSGMNRLMSDDCLIENKYDGEPFDITLPNGNKLRINTGAKTSKMLGKIAGAYNLPGFEDFRICHSQVLNQKNIGGTLTLSIHPMDYMTMSDNDITWESCMSWRNEGGYRQGTVEMMNSSCVIVAYLSSETDMKVWPHRGDRTSDDVWNNKKWRQLFVVNEDAILSVKDYPYHNSDLTKMVVRWIRDLAKENLGWNYNDPMEYDFGNTKLTLDHLPEDRKEFKIEINHGYMYSDFGCLDFHWLCLNPDLDPDRITHYKHSKNNWLYIDYSGRSECMVCGELTSDFEDESCLACGECQDRMRCDCCGEIITDDCYHIDGMTLCCYCYDNRTHECSECGDEHSEDNMTPIFVIPRLTAEDNAAAREKFKEHYPYDYYYTSNWNDCDDFMYFNDNADIWVCNDTKCFERWVAKYMKAGCKPHMRSIRWSTHYYVYYDELTAEAQDEWVWGFNGDNELYKKKYEYRIAYPSKFVEEQNPFEDDLPF